MKHNFEEMKELLSEELDKLTNKQDLTLGRLDTIDKLAHSIKSLATIIAMEESNGKSKTGYSREYSRNSYDNGNSYEDRRSYGMDEGASGARHYYRDSMGRFSGDEGYSGTRSKDNFMEKLHLLVKEAPASMKEEVQMFVNDMER